MTESLKVYLDTETTGLYPGPDGDEIVEIAIVDDAGNTLVNSLVKPVRVKQWRQAQAIHKISPEMVATAPTLDELTPQIVEAIAGKLVVIYNADFDSGFLVDQLAHASGIECCMLDFAETYGEWSDYRDDYVWQKLTVAASYVQHKWTGKAHRALADALACRSVWRYMHVNDAEENRRIDDACREKVIAKEIVAIIDHYFWAKKHGERRHQRDTLRAINAQLSRSPELFNYPELPSTTRGSRHGYGWSGEEILIFTGYDKYTWPWILSAEQQGLPVIRKKTKGMVESKKDDAEALYMTPKGTKLCWVKALKEGEDKPVVLDHWVEKDVERYREKGLPVFLFNQSLIPSDLIRADHEPATSRVVKLFDAAGLYVLRGGQRAVVLYDIEYLSGCPHQYTTWGDVPSHLVTKTVLKKEHGIKSVDGLTIAGWIDSRRGSYPLYDVSKLKTD